MAATFDLSGRQFAFLTECVQSLQQDMHGLSIPLVIRVGEAVTVLQDLIQHSHIEAVWSHQETWNAWTYTRDKKVASMLRSLGVVWYQPVQNGVIRALKRTRSVGKAVANRDEPRTEPFA